MFICQTVMWTMGCTTICKCFPSQSIQLLWGCLKCTTTTIEYFLLKCNKVSLKAYELTLHWILSFAKKWVHPQHVSGLWGWLPNSHADFWAKTLAKEPIKKFTVWDFQLLLLLLFSWASQFLLTTKPRGRRDVMEWSNCLWESGQQFHTFHDHWECLSESQGW